jgi:hypothetical protein
MNSRNSRKNNMPTRSKTKDHRIKETEESLKLTREQRLLVERLGEVPRDKVSSVYEQSPTLIKIHGVWKQLRF